MKIKYNDIVYVVVDNTKQGRKLVLHGFRESGSGTTRFYFAVDKDVNLTAGFTVPEAIGSKQRAEWCK
ncbi:MAG: hypothetical protein FWC51_03325 [Proteobacteria bacterium]|nr:hypothetical protein [Pseudomonadota bacterium]